MQKLAGNVDIKLNGIIEKLSDYCDEKIDIGKKHSYLVAKLKKEPVAPKFEGTVNKITTSVMPPAPEQSFAKRIAAQIQEKSGSASSTVKSIGIVKGGFSDSMKRSPKHGNIPVSGPVKVFGGSIKMPKPS